MGHSILVIFHHMMRQAASYSDLGGDFFERKRLERLGYTVAPESTATA